MKKKHIRTTEDNLLRAQVADTILYGMAADPTFAEPKEFGKWQNRHKDLLLQLFGGQGITNLGRVVAWCRREALGCRRVEPEVLCLLADALKTDTLPEEIKEGLDILGLETITDVLRGSLIDRDFSRALLVPAPKGGLASIVTLFK